MFIVKISLPAFLKSFLLGLPQTSWVCGKSGDIGRFNDDGVIGQCASIVERECKGTNKIHFLLSISDNFYFLPAIISLTLFSLR